ncbi:hypothetical protein SH528x_003722 [Novipirellula sp. SH528]|uniref:anti-sigma factor family protein n=1 Tax=Novipirellula sp. SH528 TaxID=3454466 RepID=UPI003F9F59CE
MLSCKEISKLVSQSIEHPLPFRKRMELWMHMRLCSLCSAFRRDVVYMHERMQQDAPDLSENGEGDTEKLPVDARLRIKQAIRSRQS